MKKPKFWFGFSAALAAAYVIQIPFAYYRYTTTLNSAPFWITLLVNAIVYLVPALILLIAGMILKKK